MEAGKVIGYEYTAKDKKTGNIMAQGKDVAMEQPINIKADGEYEIAIKSIDEAGNKSETQMVNVYKDETKPTVRSTNNKKYYFKWFYNSCRCTR